MSKPSARDYQSVKNFFEEYYPVCGENEEYFRFKEDIISLKPGRENAWLDAAIERGLQHCPIPAIRVSFEKLPAYYDFLILVESILSTSKLGLGLRFLPPTILMFLSQELRCKTDEQTILYSKSRISAVVTCINALVILILLVVPIYILWKLSKEINTASTTALIIGVLFIFTLILSAFLSLFTKARRHEILGAAAAYVLSPQIKS